jgi:putative serine protease PepD
MTEWPAAEPRPEQPAESVPPPANNPPPATDQPAAAEPTAYPQAGYQPTAPTPSYQPPAQPTYAAAPYGQPAPTAPSGYSSTYGSHPSTAPSYAPQPYGTQPYSSQPPYGSPAYGSQPYASAGYPTQPAYAAPSYGQPAYGSQPGPAYGQPAQPAQPAQPDRPRGRGGRMLLVAVVIAALIGAGVGAGVAAAVNHNSNHSTISFSNAAAPNSAKIDGTVAAAAAKIQPSVVTINVAGSNESGTGSGIVLDTNGDIVTNNHVVSVAGSGGQIQVITQDGQSAMATIVGVDASDDLAVIKVTGLKNLTKADFASSAALQVGQTVVAVGAPLGLSNTVTSGIVSNTARPVQTGDSSSSTATFDAIQTDAAINPGNSGGPLVNLNGDVVGINAAIATADSGGVQVPGQTQQSGSIGIGFAIPSTEASRIAAELIATGKATHAVIGVSVSDQAQSSSIQTVIGATISMVTANGPAAKAGLQVGDVVTKADTQLIITGTDLVAAARSFAPGQTITLTYQRGGSAHTAQVTLGTATS